MIRTRTFAVALVLGAATLITLVQAQRCNELLRVSSVVDHLYTCQPSPFWELQHLWSPVTVTLACASSEVLPRRLATHTPPRPPDTSVA
jgi:hypothetical protein